MFKERRFQSLDDHHDDYEYEQAASYRHVSGRRESPRTRDVHRLKKLCRGHEVVGSEEHPSIDHQDESDESADERRDALRPAARAT